jgi:oxygen-independent coproporphyrinogen-3 oxidase
LALDLTAGEGYQQYEISNYARKGCECRHNLRYWHNQPYLGFGLGAASFDGGIRWTNTSDWECYENSLDSGIVERGTEEKLKQPEALAEEVMLRLRTRWGFSPQMLSAKFGCDFWAILGETARLFLNEGLLERVEDRLRLTRKGLLLADEVCAAFLKPNAVAVSSTVPD